LSPCPQFPSFLSFVTTCPSRSKARGLNWSKTE
jgi:hypothetical protein